MVLNESHIRAIGLNERAKTCLEGSLDEVQYLESCLELLGSGFTKDELDVDQKTLRSPNTQYADNLDPKFHLRRSRLGRFVAPPDMSVIAEMISASLGKEAAFEYKANVLWLSLGLPGSSQNRQQIYTLLDDVCQSWWRGEGVRNEGMVQASYSRMAFVSAVSQWTLEPQYITSEMFSDETKQMSRRVPIILIQIAAQILIVRPNAKLAAGCDLINIAANEIQTLLELSRFSLLETLQEDIAAAIQVRCAMCTSALEDGSVKSKYLPKVLVALKKESLAPSPQINTGNESDRRMNVKLRKFHTYFSNSDIMRGEPSISIKAALLEAFFYTEMLKAQRQAIFPPTHAVEQDKYLEYIPPMFTFQSTHVEGCFPPQWLHDIMLWSMFIFLVDEYMESVVVNFSTAELTEFKSGIQQMHPDPDPALSTISIPQLPSSEAHGRFHRMIENASLRVQSALRVYYTWAQWVLDWDCLKNATASDMNQFRSEIKKYLLFHVHQIEDNCRLAAQQNRTRTEVGKMHHFVQFTGPRTAYSTWVHTVGAGHISAPISLAFATCYMGSWARNGKNGWSNVLQAVLAHETNIHVGAYCRMYNDYGSVTRDTAECNLNSINFPEFWPSRHHGCYAQETGQDHIQRNAKDMLLELAKHERAMADILAEKLYATLEAERSAEGATIAAALRIYFRSGELFSDMYLTRDVTNTVK